MYIYILHNLNGNHTKICRTETYNKQMRLEGKSTKSHEIKITDRNTGQRNNENIMVLENKSYNSCFKVFDNYNT